MFLPTVLIFLSLIVGFLLFISFPSYFISSFFAWIVFAPLLSQISERVAWESFLSLLLCGMTFFLGIFSWIFEVQGYTLWHHAMLAVYLGSYFGFFGLGFSLIARRLGPVHALAAAPFLWAALEYIRSNFFFLALPWGLLAHSQYRHPLFLQIASVTGVYGVSFLILLVNAALAGLVMLLLSKTSRFQVPYAGSISGRQAITLATATLVLVVVACTYGHYHLKETSPGTSIAVALVQGNIPQEKKWNPRYAREIVQIHSNLTREASQFQAQLIVWPETATPRSINRDPDLAASIRKLANAVKTPLLIGSSQTMKFKQHQSKKVRYKNSAVLIHPETSFLPNQQYDKVRLMPFGEYLPYEKTIPWARFGVGGIDSYLPGEELTIFQIPEARFGVTICWENLFPDLVRKFVKRGAQFIVNITNEAWFGDTAAPHQFLSMSVFRAVENGVWVVRCANTGISCFIDPHGRIVEKVADEKGKDTFVRGVVSRSINPIDAPTFYTRHGDVFAWICLLVSAVTMVVSLSAGKLRSPKAPVKNKQKLD